jgi:hypothetical protein
MCRYVLLSLTVLCCWAQKCGDDVCLMLSTIFIPVLLHMREDACGRFVLRLFNDTASVAKLI